MTPAIPQGMAAGHWAKWLASSPRLAPGGLYWAPSPYPAAKTWLTSGNSCFLRLTTFFS